MRTYAVFCGHVYYPLGGAYDFIKDFDNEADAVQCAYSHTHYMGVDGLVRANGDWANVLELPGGRSVFWSNKRGILS